MQPGKQVLVSNSGSVIFSAFWFLFRTKCSTVKTFGSQASGRARSNRPLWQAIGSSKGLEQPVIQASRSKQLQTRGRGRKAERHSSAYSVPWGKFLRGRSPPPEKAPSRQFALLQQEGEKVPERKGTGIAPVVSHKPGGEALSSTSPLYPRNPRSWEEL